jgi:hypothetical protein
MITRETLRVTHGGSIESALIGNAGAGSVPVFSGKANVDTGIADTGATFSFIIRC